MAGHHHNHHQHHLHHHNSATKLANNAYNDCNDCIYCQQEIKLGGRFNEYPPINIKDQSSFCDNGGSFYKGQLKSRTLTRTYKPLNDLGDSNIDSLDSYRITKMRSSTEEQPNERV